MTAAPWRFVKLDRISGQLAALVVASLLAIHVIITVAFLLGRPDGRPMPGADTGQLISLIQLIGAVDAAERLRIVADVSRAFPALNIEMAPAGAVAPGDADEDGRIHFFRRRLGDNFHVVALPETRGMERRLLVTLPDGVAIASNFPTDGHRPPFLGGPLMTALLFGIVCVSLLGLWAARALTAPLSAFAKAAQDFSLTGAPAPLPERGPEEIRSAAEAFNRMRERITTLIDDRTRMLAAISHDLRTPITRLWLRSEFIEDRAQREYFLQDLNQMRAMLDSVLSFLRDDRKAEAMTLVDIAVTAQVICDQFADMNHAVRYVGPLHAMMTARPNDLHRAVTNIVENAVKFGTEVTVRLEMQAGHVTIEIEDNGPGISDASKVTVLEPFVRGDEARTMDDAGGFGLGLAITKAIVDAHEGQLSLRDRQPNGLIVQIDMPIEGR